MNTRICYLYRDSDNYKVHNMCVIHGELTDSPIDQILEECEVQKAEPGEIVRRVREISDTIIEEL